MIINISNLKKTKLVKKNTHRFIICDEFISDGVIDKIIQEIYTNRKENDWVKYSNLIEEKSTISDWNKFGPLTYKVLYEMCSKEINKIISKKFSVDIVPDYGIHGGGIHFMSGGGALNPHLDYEVHPKLMKTRLINAILYLTESGKDYHGGELGLWDDESFQIKGSFEKEDLIKRIKPVAGRLVLFDVSGKNWHGLVSRVNGGDRISLATYYVSSSDVSLDKDKEVRWSALFAHDQDTKNNKNADKSILLRRLQSEKHKY